MKAFLSAVVFAAAVAIGAAFVIDARFGQDSTTAFTTTGARPQ
jgi:hypothetical protein